MAVTETGHAAARELDELYRRHGAQVYRYALAVLGNHSDAEDVTQSTFLSAYGALEQGVRPRKPVNWLLTIASNAIKQRFRQESSRPRQVALDDDIADTSPDEEGPTVGELLAALSKIPPQQRQAIVLREFEGRSYGEIADILGVTQSALETLLFRARKSLAEELEHQLTCTDAQLAISKAADERLGRKERRRLREHLGECPDCSRFARLQQRHRTALKGLLLVPVPVSLTLLRGFEGTASAATLQTVGAATAAGVTATVGTGAAVVGVGAGTGAGAGAAGGGLFAGGLALKAAAVVSAAAVTGGVAVTGATEIAPKARGNAPAQGTKLAPGQAPGQRLGQTAPRGATGKGNGVARGATSVAASKRATAAQRSSKPAGSSATRSQGKASAARGGATPATKKPATTGRSAAAKGDRSPARSSRAPVKAASNPTPQGLSKTPRAKGTPAKPAGTTGSTGSGKGQQGGKPEK
ncbi:MAG: sigma-70 family RNA polymerase sigma factor [Gaiellaceae bacterium]